MSQSRSNIAAGASSRPSSAGATRNRAGSFGTNRGSTGVTNLYTSANPNVPFVQGNSTTQRPSSAGYGRSTSNPSNQQPQVVNVSYGQGVANNGIPININHINLAGNNPVMPNNIPNNYPSTNPYQPVSNARPKSAGAVRRGQVEVNNYNNTQIPNNIYQPGTYPTQPHYPQPTNPNQTKLGQPVFDQQYNPYTNTVSYGTQPNQRPLSANATSHTTNPQMYSNYMQDWNTSANFKGPSKPSSQVPSMSQGQQPIQIPGTMYVPVNNDNKPSRPSSSAATKLRNALDLSHKMDDNNIPVSNLIGIDNDPDDDGLDEPILGVEGVDQEKRLAADAGDDEEMDGKPVDSRSHPEVSMATPSASLELGNGSSVAVDVRNTSIDSFSDDNIQIGISTVPNQFCTKRDALELRKLLLMAVGARGGIVPSSSAVMDMYMVGKVVGVGSYGKVRAAWHRLTGSKIAIKTYDKSKLKDPAHWKRVHSEIKIMEQVSHPRIARMYEAVETPKRMHLIMECLDGGNLCSYVKAKRRLSEDESRRIFFQILQAIEYLHSLGVSHRDVKLENVLFVNERDIKLIDFGFSTVCQPGKKLKVFCGTPSYMAPEIVRRVEYEGKPVDIWSLGILLYALLCGCFPFRAKAYPDLYRRIARGTFAIPDELSSPVKDLLRLLLTVDPETRVTAQSALRHPWLQVQLVNAPNMDKLRQEMTVLISEKPADDLDEQVLSELAAFGLSRDEIIRLVLTKTHSSIATLYYLLLDVAVSRRRSAVKKGNGNLSSGNLGLNQKNNANNGKVRSLLSAQSSGTATMMSNINNIQVAGAMKITPSPMLQNTPLGMNPVQNMTYAMANMTLASNNAPNVVYDPQQQLAEQYTIQQQIQLQQQQFLDKQELRYRPKSASQNRNSSSGSNQRPLSAYAGRR